ncbi:lysM domain receptor-like kinase 4 [Bidens hawaiensis]|uniref:lysM domain receptor-like kinase 4 n=1 Tax=Bidens hawaiensis TaxID=980011 RepID=UPI00404A67F3
MFQTQLQFLTIKPKNISTFNMNLFHFIFTLVVFFTIQSHAQQMYSGNLVLDCNNSDEMGASPAFLYACNGIKPSCPAFLMFRTQPLYDTVMTISKLMSVDHTSLARINNIMESNKILPLNKELIIPVTCSCIGEYYQANTTFVIPTDDDTYFTIANSTYQGLTTCSSLMRNNIYDQYDLHPGQNLQVPLRCACPTVSQTQTTMGVRFLLTYLITWKDSLKKISKRFNVSTRDLALANGFSSANENDIFPFTTLLVPLSNEPLSSMTRTLGQKQNLSEKRVLIGVIVGSVLAILCCLCVGCFLWKRNRKNSGKKEIKWVLPKDIQLGIASVDQNFKIYRFEELEEASDGFSLQNRLSASVYEGSLGGKKVVIKQMGANANKEVKILQKFNHFNLIGLYGVCEHDKACFLVYEFMENGCLKDWLANKTSQENQTWIDRIRIGLDVAKGLQYLHNFASPAYVHKDINSNNILLSKDLRAKISKFGLARSTEKGQNGNSSIKCPLESKGYHAPEYIESGTVSTKIDVYAFGVVLLELITGWKAVCENDDGEQVMLSEKVIAFMGDEKYAKDKVNYLIDPRLQARQPLGFVIDHGELATRLVKLSLACLEADPERRLSMNDVVSTLMMIQMDAQCLDIMFTV